MIFVCGTKNKVVARIAAVRVCGHDVMMKCCESRHFRGMLSPQQTKYHSAVVAPVRAACCLPELSYDTTYCI